MKDLTLSYILALAGFFTPVAGLHRFYLGRPGTGFLYLITWGLLGIGTLVDLVRMPEIVRDENRRYWALTYGPPDLQALPSRSRQEETEEMKILRAAEKNEGSLTVARASLASGLDLKRCQRILDRLERDGFCSPDVSEEGSRLYLFTGLRSNKPLKLD